jgi:ankyrin repeat protein
MHECATLGSLELLRVLLEAGGDPWARDRRGRTPRERAEANGHVQVAEGLRQEEEKVRVGSVVKKRKGRWRVPD